MREFCEPFPLTIIADQLGVPRADLELFRTWSDAFVAQLSRKATPDQEIEAVKQIVQFQHYFAAKLEERKKEPKNDIISDIANARLDGERPLDTAESLSILQQLLVAGNETTTAAIAEGMLLMIRESRASRTVAGEPGTHRQPRRGGAQTIVANGQHVAHLHQGYGCERYTDSGRQHVAIALFVGQLR